MRNLGKDKHELMSDSIYSQYLWQTEFESICSFADQHVEPILKELSSNKELKSILNGLFFDSAVNSPEISEWFHELGKLNSIEAFQSWIQSRIFPLIEASYNNLTVEGIDQLDPDRAYIFISNHRDIVMDPLLLNLTLRENGFSSAHCAIGDNLLVSPIANNLARLNLCFKVIRSLKSPKAILKAMKLQSAYIAHQHFELNNNIWIAQKEGRSKDNIDKTNPALIKMLGLCRPKALLPGSFYNELNIVPVCYSYEWDPCDVDKARQLEAASNGGYTKSHEDDFSAVKKGLSGAKGDIHLKFGQPIYAANEDLSHGLIADKIDQFIHNNYQIYPINIAAYKKLFPNDQTDSPFDKSTLNLSRKLLEKKLETEEDKVQQRVLKAYAAPVIMKSDQA